MVYDYTSALALTSEAVLALLEKVLRGEWCESDLVALEKVLRVYTEDPDGCDTLLARIRTASMTDEDRVMLNRLLSSERNYLNMLRRKQESDVRSGVKY